MLITCIGILSIIYIVFAARPLAHELQMTPAWTINIQQPIEPADGKQLLPYKLGQIMGYFTEDGRIVSSITFPYKATITNSFFTQYSGDATTIPFYATDGSQAGTIKQSGFPFFSKDQIYQFLPGGSSFMQCNEDGSEKWRYENISPITAFSSSDAGCAAGFADGTLIAFDHDGNILQEFSPGGSDYSIILGAALSPDGQYIACISGLHHQRVVLAKRGEQHSVISFFKYFDTDQTSQVLVKFSQDSSILYYNYPGGLGIVHCDTGRTREFPIKGWISAIEESPADGTAYVLSHEGSDYTVSVLESSDDLLGAFSFTASSAFILTNDDSLFVGKDMQISRLALTKN